MTTREQQQTKENFSKILADCRSLAMTITRDRRIKVRYDPKMPTSAFAMETNEITLSLTPYPDFVKTQPFLFKKILDGDLAHECGHHIFTKPLWDYFNNWVTRIKRQRGFYRLAHEVCNIVEDKRINHFIILRYRFDVGKRLLLANLILKDMIDNTVEPKAIQKGNFTTLEETATGVQPIDNGLQEGVYIMAILCNQGLYEAKCTEFWNKLTPIAKADCIQALKVLEDVKYKRLRIDVIRACQELYDLIAKHLKADYTSRQYIVSRRGGTLKGDISPELRAKLEAEAKKELDEGEKDKHLKDIQKGSGAGEGSISGNSEVYAKIDGKLWFGTISELEKQIYLKLEVLTVVDFRITWKEAKLINHGNAQLYKITLKSGKEVLATANHNLFRRKYTHSSSSRLFEMVRTDNLKVGNSMAIPSYLPIKTNDLQIKDDLVYLVGLWLADGSFNDNNPKRTVNISLDERDTETKEKLGRISANLDLILHEKQDNGRGKTYRLYSVKLVEKLESLGCTYPKQIPNWVFVASDRQIKIFLEGYIDGDGHIPQDKKHKFTFQISCIDKTVIKNLQTLFLRLRIFSHISKNEGKRKGKNPIWVLETTRKKYPEVTFRQVKSIELSGIETIYDFSVPETENFIANNILLHNTGEEIPAPEPDFARYYELLDACKPEITELLNRLKKTMKPRVSREIFQKRGRIMSPIVPKIFANSFRGTIKNVFTGIDTKFEKEQVSLQFLFDFSGSVDKEQAEKITCILNEVFGHYVDDAGFSIACFGADSQKVKTFFESFDNTKARVGNIGVNACGTEISVLLEASLKMFNTIKGERKKMLIIASDFEVCDEERALDLLEQYARSGIECIFIGFCGCDKVDTFANNVKKLKVRRTRIQEISELPSAFLSVYLERQR